jgi:anthranilate phosphoribosyltransferase
MRLRGETVGEITACARAMRRAAITLRHPHQVIDVCGTGGDGAHTFNISTAAALVAAGAGVKVAKHGGRAVSSLSGSPDVLSALGVDINADADHQRAALESANICMLFAPNHHRAMRHVAPVRAELGFRTLFNLLGPLSNPAGARRQLLGVFDPRLTHPLAEVLGRLGAVRAWVVHGEGMDELTTTGLSTVSELKDGIVRDFTLDARDLGLPRVELSALRGGDPQTNARALLGLLDGETGPYRDIVLLNAAATLVVADFASDLEAGLALARASIDEGKAKKALERLKAASNQGDPA